MRAIHLPYIFTNNILWYLISFPFQSPEDQLSSSVHSLKSEDGILLKVTAPDDRRLSEGDILDPKSSKGHHKPLTSRSQPVSPHTERSHKAKRDPSPTPSSSSDTSSLVEGASAIRPPPPPCSIGEKVGRIFTSHMTRVGGETNAFSLSLSLSLTHTHTHTRTHAHTHTRTHAHTHTRMHIHMHTHTYTHAYRWWLKFPMALRWVLWSS